MLHGFCQVASPTFHAEEQTDAVKALYQLSYPSTGGRGWIRTNGLSFTIRSNRLLRHRRGKLARPGGGSGTEPGSRGVLAAKALASEKSV